MTKTIQERKEEYNKMWNKGEFEWNYHDGETVGTKPFSLERIWNVFIEPSLQDVHTQALEEERERIENELNKHIAPHPLSLEDSVWLKRLLNKVFGHDKRTN